MGQSILQVKDAEGNWNSILALKGDNGLTPFIGENGNWWIGDIDTGVRAKGLDGVLVETGTYVGTNTVANEEQDNPPIINFDFAPKFVMVVNSDYGGTKYKDPSSALLIRDFPYGFRFGHSNTSSEQMYCKPDVYTSFTENSVSFWNRGVKPGYFNASGTTYHYFAIG